ncbi:xaa-Pro aminopeptidase 1-like [Scylla paramamosain]|uniref:xaa-Pro aminopeptidase 1-like n=1 Tax=Scylla paramamosain TaxID=85552 RepID=UPI0030835F26
MSCPHPAEFNITLEAEEMNLVDLVWPQQERPKYSDDPIFVLETRFAGKSWEEKVREVREEMVKKGADMLVVTALDEVAWLLNLRGNDIPYNPVFRAYVILTPDRLELYVPAGKIMPAVDSHLRVNQCGDGRECVTINDYVSILDSLRALRLRNTVKKVLLGAKYSYSGGASYAIYSAVPEKMRVKGTSPILLMKARKNPKEVEGMKRAHVKDAVALCDFLSFLENEIEAGRYWSEISAAQRLEEYRGQQQDFVGISFDTISAFGSNGAIVHYAPSKETSKQITNESLYLLDSGGQYKDLATLVFPEGTGDTDVDILARRHLYAVGLDYRHGSGHGIGMFLNVHEAFESTYRLNYFGSHEPGFYLDGDFGIRLENILTVIPKETTYHFDKQSLGFEPVTLVPFEPRLINTTLLSARQVIDSQVCRR